MNDAANWFGLEGLPPDETEIERVFEVVPSALPKLPAPWVLLQAYSDTDHSLRVIPARQTAFARIKAPGIMSEKRKKTSRPVDFRLALEHYLTLARFAVKERYLLRDDTGRAWLIDHMLTGDRSWLAETELQNAPPLDSTPVFVGEDWTEDRRGYTYTHTEVGSKNERMRWISYAMMNGIDSPYTPSEDENFEWVHAK